MSCPNCCSNNLLSLVERKKVPVYMHIFYDSYAEALDAPTGDLKIEFCLNCTFVFNSSFEPNKVVYNESYDNNTCISTSFKEYIYDNIDSLNIREELKGKKVLEIGCGRGGFLRLLNKRANISFGVGIDPCYEDKQEGNLVFKKKFFSNDDITADIDLIVSRHLVEHITNPIEKILRHLISVPSKTRIIIETPDVGWILKNKVFWDFYYEHCSLFSAVSMKYALKSLGFEKVTIKPVFGKQFLWTEVGFSKEKPALPRASLKNSLKYNAKAFIEAVPRLLEKQDKNISRAIGRGNVAIWGAGAKGVTYANIMDPFWCFINCLIDINPNKVGKYIPCSGHKVVSVQDMKSRNIKSIILMNPNYKQEAHRRLSDAGLNSVKVINI